MMKAFEDLPGDILEEDFQKLERDLRTLQFRMCTSDKSETSWEPEPPDGVSFWEHFLTLSWHLERLRGEGANTLEVGEKALKQIAKLPGFSTLGSQKRVMGMEIKPGTNDVLVIGVQ